MRDTGYPEVILLVSFSFFSVKVYNTSKCRRHESVFEVTLPYRLLVDACLPMSVLIMLQEGCRPLLSHADNLVKISGQENASGEGLFLPPVAK